MQLKILMKMKGVSFQPTRIIKVQEIVIFNRKRIISFNSTIKKTIAKTFQSWMTDVIKEIRLTGMYRLKQENEVDKQLLKNKHKKEIHQMFLEKYKHKNVVYIIQLEDENYEKENKILIKIGNTQNIKERFSHLHNDFDHINVYY
jgi:prophage antirepressor-like protein